MRVRETLLVAWKFGLSFRKTDWDLRDYPIVIREQEPLDPIPLKTISKEVREPVVHRYLARVVNWWAITGSGDTPEDAMVALQESFTRTKEHRSAVGESLLRPGTRMQITFASMETIEAYRALAEDFIRRVLDLEWAMITDESSLWDFHTEKNNDSLNAKIKDTYNVDVSDIESGNLAKILQRIAQHQ